MRPFGTAAKSAVTLFAVSLLAMTLGAAPAPTTAPIPSNAKGAKGLESAVAKLHAPTRDTRPLSPLDSLKQFHPADGLAVDLVAAEPAVRQPLCINFDARGRMWVTQYIQYPYPSGLRVVEYDQYLRAKYDKVPPPPPLRNKGADRITIHEDVNGDGSFAKVTTFLDGLDLATSALPDRDGVWVMNPPYLLFYPDANHDDVPDGPPVVHLSGFGIEDTHAVASNLTFGPDGWIYGAQGSTCTSKVKAELGDTSTTTDFLGQAIWRYHPKTHRFELFAEGGGNTFGVAFDAAGRLFSGTNWGKWRGLHFVQGGYYIKNWGKHGELTNPHAFGYLEHMPHEGNDQRLTHTFDVYDGGLLPDKYKGKLLGPNPLQSRVGVTRLVPVGSTYRTAEEDPLLTSDDLWFRPVDIKTGPDGAVYLADFYENRISHVDPRDTWDRITGRIWRVRPKDWKPGVKAFDLTKEADAQLIERLKDPNGWRRGMARREIAARALDELRRADLVSALGRAHDPLPKLESFWTLNLMGTSPRAELRDPDPMVRSWAARIIGDDRPVALDLQDAAAHETNAQVRSQLASTAKRVQGTAGLEIVWPLLAYDEDVDDPHIPLLLWWAIESKAVANRQAILDHFATSEAWQPKIARSTIVSRLARLWSGEAEGAGQPAVLKLLRAAPGEDERKLVYAGVKEAFEQRELQVAAPELAEALRQSGDVELALRVGDAAAYDHVFASAASESTDAKTRLRQIELLAQVAKPQAASAFLDIAEKTKASSVRLAAVSAAARFDDAAIGKRLIDAYPKFDKLTKVAVVKALTSRPTWATDLVKAVKDGRIARADVPEEQVEHLRHLGDADLATAVDRLFGSPVRTTGEQKELEIARVRAVLTTGAGDAAKGKATFTARCAQCHTLFNEGGRVGPELTGYERRNTEFLLLSVIDPSAYVREEYTQFRVKTTDGRVLDGLVAERGPGQITLLDPSGQKTAVPREQIKEERALPTSIMPEELLTGLSDGELRDFFAYLQSERRK